MKKKITVKKSLLAMFLMLLCVTGCGNSESKNTGMYDSFGAESQDSSDFEEVDVNGIDNAYSGEMSEEDASTATEEEENRADGNGNVKEDGEQVLDREMLVYRGNLIIDTLDFDQSVGTFRDVIKNAGGFVEEESTQDGGDLYSDYQISKSEKRYEYEATVRVPSKKFDEIMEGSSTLGDVRSKSSNVENVTQQYGTCKSELEVYQVEERRYLELLEKAKKDETVLEIEEKLFDLQVKIAELKSTMKNIESDVTYSYIQISIRQVTEYAEEPEVTDTFMQRLVSTCKSSVEQFISVLEGILFFLIYTWYYILIIAIVVYIFIKRKRKKKVAGKKTQDSTEEEKKEK